MPHGRPGRTSRSVFPLRTFRHLLQLVSQSSLSKMPGQCPPPLAAGTPARVAAHSLRARRFHSAAGTGPTRPAEQETHLRLAVPHQRHNPARSGSRSQTSGRRDRFLQRAAHLGSEAPTSSPCPLRGPRRWTLAGSHPLDPHPLLFLSSHQSAESGFSRQVRGCVEARRQRRKTPLLWRSESARSAQDVLRLAPSTVPARLGGLLQTALRWSRACPTLSRRLHPPRRHL